MPEPTSSTIAAVSVTAGGLTLFGIATGLHPMLLLAGLAGGWWALSYQTDPMPLVRRCSTLGISALVSAWVSPPAVAGIVAMALPQKIPAQSAGELLQFPVALIVGLLAHAVLGPALMKLAAKKIEGAA